MMKKPKRFELIYSQGAGSVQIWLDKKTSVNYLFKRDGYGGGLTPLLNRDGKPTVSAVSDDIDF